MADNGILDFLTVCTEYCAFVEQTEKTKKKDFVETAQKILSLLYLKASILKSPEDIDGYCETFVTEDDWTFIQTSVAEKLGEQETFLSIIEPDNYQSGNEVSVSISECFADIYQDVRDYIERYRTANVETQEVALFECLLNFKLYWGPRLLATLNELHALIYSTDVSLDDDE